MKEKFKAVLLKVKAFLKKWLAPQIPFLFFVWLFLWVYGFIIAIPLYPNFPDSSIGFSEVCAVLASADDRTQAVYLCVFCAVFIEDLLDWAQLLHMCKLFGQEAAKLYLLLKSKLRARCAKK